MMLHLWSLDKTIRHVLLAPKYKIEVVWKETDTYFFHWSHLGNEIDVDLSYTSFKVFNCFYFYLR